MRAFAMTDRPGWGARLASSGRAVLGLTREGRPPGPWNPFPWVRLVRSYRKDPLGHLERMATLGDVVYGRIGQHRTFFLNHPDHVEHVLLRARGRYQKDPLLHRLRPLLGERGLLLSEGARWKTQRRLMAPAFTPRRVATQYADTMLGCAREVAAGLADGPIDVCAAMTRLTLDVAVRTLFGARVDGDGERVGAAFTIASAFFGRSLGALRLPRWVPTPANRELAGALADLDDVVRRLVSGRAASRPEGEDLLGQMLAAGMDPAALRDEVLTLLLAGHETTSLLLTYALALLARAPGIQADLRAELEDELGGRDPSPDDLARLPLLRQVLRESLRLYPPAAVVGRQATEDDEIGGFHVPRGSLVFMSQWVIHRDRRSFEAPLEFRPGRWTPAFEASLPRFAYFPFGGGERTCIGEEFALLEASLALAVLVRRATFRCDHEGPLVVVPEITLRPVEPVLLRVRRR